MAGPAGHKGNKGSHHGTRSPARARGSVSSSSLSSSSTPAQFPRPAPVPAPAPAHPGPSHWRTSGKHLDPAGAGGGGEPAWEGAIFIKLPGRGQWGPTPRGAGLGAGQDAAEPGGSCRIPGEQRPAPSPAGTSALVRPQGVGSRRAVPEKTRLILVGPGRELAPGGAENVPVSRAPKTPDPPRRAPVRVQQHHVCGAGAQSSQGRPARPCPTG